jgi:hypothetical protein
MSWRRKNEFDDLEARLRAARPEPPEELVQSLSRAVRGHGGRRRSVVQLGFAFALTLALAVTLAALGGLAHTATAASGVVTFVQTGSFSTKPTPDGSTTASSSAVTTESETASDDQYEEDVTICHRTRANQTGDTLTVSPSGADNHSPTISTTTKAPAGRDGERASTHHSNGVMV